MNFFDDLYEQCSDHSALMTSSSNLLGLRPNFFRKYLFSAFVMPDIGTKYLNLSGARG